jgi:hypothetical protein
MFVGPFSLLLLAFAVPSFSAPMSSSSMSAYNISRNDNVRISALDLRGRTLIIPTACCVCRHNFPQKVPILTTTRYWGQDGAGNQEDISAYCKDNTTDNIIMAFLNVFFSEGGQPEINLANVCIQSHSRRFDGSYLRKQRHAARLATMFSMGPISWTALGWLLK